MNPVSKARDIVDYITRNDVLLSNNLIGILTRELTAEEIDIIWIALRLDLNALNDD